MATNRYSTINTVVLILLFVVLEVISIILINNNSIVQKYRIMGSVQSFQSFFWKADSNISRYFSLKEENDLLIQENHQLKQQLLDFQSVNIYDTDSLFVDIDGDFKITPATIIKNSTNKQHNYLVLNRGAVDSISEGMGVISKDGVVGVVSSVTDHYSYVISLLNTSQSVSVKVANSNYYGPMRWDGVSYNKAIMSDVPLFCEAAQGDTVVTSGLSAIFPPDIPVGVISKIESIGGLYKTLNITLFQKFSTLNTVYLVTNKNLKEIQELEKRGDAING